MNISYLKEELQKHKIEFSENESLSKYTTFRVGGSALIMARPKNSLEMIHVQKIVLKKNIPFFLLGGGSNVLISDEGLDFVIYPQFKEEFKAKEHENHIKLEVASNVRNGWLSLKMSKLGFSGLEFLSTIPGKIGGAVVQNAGCYGCQIQDILESVEVVNKGRLINLSANELNLSYRNSLFKQDKLMWISKAVFLLQRKEPPEIEKKISDYKSERLKSQPKNRRSAGSIFKNPENGLKAWQLIENAGLRGYSIGEAVVSDKHANFILNEKNARASDIYRLICYIEKTVKEKFEISLEREVQLLGRFNGQDFF
ncbi:MAG: UDP-N-acetylmuramate dehydrogenase [Spirochaetia bacterium]|nr:UDP-N-acetylmuramate dehydrogenase [Spirochaetia bacterium]